MESVEGTLKILGCGNSFGVPTASGNWGQCDPNEPKNRRRRCSALLQYENKNIVIDTGPDFRDQCLTNDITHIDSIIYTHYHGDHANGIEDIRSFFHSRGNTPIESFMLEDTYLNLSRRFEHCFIDSNDGLYKAIIKPTIVKELDLYKPYNHKDLDFKFVLQDHNTCDTLGIRIGDLAYSVDLKDMNQKSIDSLKGIKTWIIDAADAWNGSGLVHCTIEKVLELNKQVNAEEIILTSLKPSNDYNTLSAELEQKGYKHIKPAYDGLELTFNVNRN